MVKCHRASRAPRDELFVQTGVGRAVVTTQHTEKAALVWRNHTHNACAKSLGVPLSTTTYMAT